MAISLTTEDKLAYTFYPASSSQLQFRVKAPNDAHIALTTGPSDDQPIYEVFIGGWGNSKSVIRKNKTQPDVSQEDTPAILSNDELRGFWIRWGDGQISVGKEGEPSAILSYFDPEPFDITHFGVCTAWGAQGEWLIEAICIGDHTDHSNASVPSAPAELTSSGSICWCDASGGTIPPGSLEGGDDGEPLYVARANHEGAVIPGKLKPSHGVCYIAWGGEEHGKSDYQVLCGCNGNWVAASGGDIPSNAIPAGETEDGEPLFVGRVNHEGTMTIGKVQASHSVCYIPFGGSEVPFAEYEILVDN